MKQHKQILIISLFLATIAMSLYPIDNRNKDQYVDMGIKSDSVITLRTEFDLSYE